MYKKQPSKRSGTTRTNSTKKRSSAKKSKVYIPAYKVIMLCAAIIAICMTLLLVTSIKNPEVTDQIQSSISERFEEPKNKVETTKENVQKPQPQKVPPKQSQKPAEKKPLEQKNTPAARPEKQSAKTSEPQKQQNKQPEKKSATPEVKAPAARYNFPKAVNSAKLIFVFDDGGQNNSHLEKFLQLPFPITVAVLPQLTNSKTAAQKVRASGNEVILHQPMQSISNTVNPGPGAITPDMNDAQIITQLFLNINEIGPVAGMNNHEGSAITADAEKMAIILQTASENGIYFLDSRTNVETKVPYVAHELGYSYYERNIFLDNEKTEAFALKELRRGLDIANKNGNVIMIGHIWSADFLPAFLQKVYPELKAAGYTFTTVSNSTPKR